MITQMEEFMAQLDNREPKMKSIDVTKLFNKYMDDPSTSLMDYDGFVKAITADRQKTRGMIDERRNNLISKLENVGGEETSLRWMIKGKIEELTELKQIIK